MKKYTFCFILILIFPLVIFAQYTGGIGRGDITSGIIPIPKITETIPSSNCVSGTVRLEAKATSGTVNWYDVPEGGVSIAIGTFWITPSLSETTTFYVDAVFEYSPGKFSASPTRVPIVATIYPEPLEAPTGISPQTLCWGTLADLIVTGSNIQWYSAATGGSPLPISTTLTDGTHYFASQTIGSCESVPRLDIEVIILPGTPPPTGLTPQFFANKATVGDLQATGTDIKWYSVSSGGTPLTSNVTLINGNHYYATQTISGCESEARLDVTVISELMFRGGNGRGDIKSAIVSIPTILTTTPSSNCVSGTVLLKATASAGTINWYNVPTGGTSIGTGSPWTTPSISTTTTYYVDATYNGVTSPSRTPVTATIFPDPLDAPTGTSPQTLCWGTLADLIVTGSNIQWYSIETGGSPLPLSTVLIDGTHYYASQTVGSCESIPRLDVEVIVLPAISAPTGTTPQPFIDYATVANLVATGTAIQWYATSSGGTPLATTTALVNGTHYYATQTVGGCESQTRLDVTSISEQMFRGGNGRGDIKSAIISTPMIQTTTPSSNCVSGTVILEATALPAASTINWYNVATGGSSIGTGSPWTTPSISTTTTFYVEATYNGITSPSRIPVIATIFPDPLEAPTGPSPQTLCWGTLEDITITGDNIKWYATASNGSILPNSTNLVDGTHYYASQSVGSCESVPRLDVLVNLFSPATSPPTGNTPQYFTDYATIEDLLVNGTDIKWYSTSSGGTALASNTPLVNGTTYYASQTLNGCESQQRLAVNVICELMFRGGRGRGDIKSAIISIPMILSTTPNSNCLGGTVTLAATATTGSTINWYDVPTGGTPIGTGSPWTTPPISSTTIFYVDATYNGITSPSRTPVSATNYNTSLDPPTGDSPQSFCFGTVEDLIAVGTNIQWYSTSSGGSPLLPTTELIDGFKYYASQTVGGCESSLRLEVSVIILPETESPTGVSPQYFPDYATVANIVATGNDIKWYDTESKGTPLSGTTILINGNTYYATQTLNGCENKERLAVTIISELMFRGGSGRGDIKSAMYVMPNILSTTPNSNCVSGPLILGATASAGIINWYDSATGGNWLGTGTSFTTPSISETTTFYVDATYNGVTSFIRTPVTATIYLSPPPAPTGEATQTFCNYGTVAELTASGLNIKWYDVPVGGTVLTPDVQLIDGAHYYASQQWGECEGDLRLDVTVIINTPPAPSGIANQTYCDGALVEDLAATGLALHTWYSAPTGGIPLASSVALVNGNHYYASQTLDGCESIDRFDVFITINYVPPQPPSGISPQIICEYGTVANLSSIGTLTKWYLTPFGGTALSNSTVLIDGNHYYASQTVNGCESLTRLDVLVEIQSLPSAPTGDELQIFCNSGKVSDLKATGTEIKWYDAPVNGNLLAPETELINDNHYFASQTVNNCESNIRLEVQVEVNSGMEAPTGLSLQEFCKEDNPKIADIEATGSNLKWYDAENDGNLLNQDDVLVDGTIYYASQTVSDCESVNRLPVTVTLSNVSVGGTIESDQQIPEGSKPDDLILIGYTGSIFKWQKDDNSAFSSPEDIAVTINTLEGATIGNLTETTYFRVIVKNGACAESYSDYVTITVTSVGCNPVDIIEQPTGGDRCEGQSFTFYVIVSGDEPFSYQWKKDNNIIDGATTSNYNISVLSVNDSGSYSCYITNCDGTEEIISEIAELNISSTVVITYSPADASVKEGGITSFSVATKGSGFNYLWEVNTGTGWTIINDGGIIPSYSGATTYKLIISDAVLTMNNYKYRCIVSNSCLETKTSDNATLTVRSSASGGLWVGITDTDWDKGSNWDTGIKPEKEDNVIIPSSAIYQPEVNNFVEAECHHITIMPRASLSVIGTGSIHIYGNLLIKSDKLGTGAFTNSDDATIIIDGAATMERYMSSPGYHYLSTPINGANLSQIEDNVPLKNLNAMYFNPDSPPSSAKLPNIWKIDETHTHDVPYDQNAWLAPDGYETMPDMTGYALIIANNPVTIDISGPGSNLNKGNKTYTVTKSVNSLDLLHNNIKIDNYGKKDLVNGTNMGTGPGNGWHLIGNPYPSPVDWDAVINGGGVTGSIGHSIAFFRATSLYFGIYGYYNPTIGSSGAFHPTQYIPSMQSFSIKNADEPGNPILTLKNSFRNVSYDALSNEYHKKSYNSKNIYPTIRLTAENLSNNITDETVVAFIPDANEGYDPKYDAEKIFNTDLSVPNIYTKSAKSKCAINVLPVISENLTIPVGFSVKKEGKYMIKAKTLLNLPTGINVYLNDNYNNNKQNLSINPDYIFNTTLNDNYERFYLSFSSLSNDLIEYYKEKLNVYIDNNVLYINYNNNKTSNKGVMTIYEAQGKLIEKPVILHSGSYQFELNHSPGLYFVKIVTDSKVYINKIYLK